MKNTLSFETLLEDIKLCTDVINAKKILYQLFSSTPMLEKALDYCIKMHEGQFRKSGEPYSVHPILVACFVAYFAKDESMILAALLHDVVEDTECTQEELITMFGHSVGVLVEGLTKIVEIRGDNLASSNSNEKLRKSALTFRNMLMVSIEDSRVLLVKLCDRLHNMLTLDALKEAKQKRIAEETLMVYAPIAHRLGISSIKDYLEDLSFKYLMPEEFNQIAYYLKANNMQLQLTLNDFIDKIKELLRENNYIENEDYVIKKRIKHTYSIYLKMQRKGISIEEVLDLLGVRILVKEIKDCYIVLGILHVHFNPLASRFKDYIALPKQNGYQTLHTTLFDSQSIIEAQIRTFKMHETAELGIAAHWKYKNDKEDYKAVGWVSDLAKDNQEKDDELEFYEYAKDSLYVEDIAVYSPKGEIFTLPRGSTALDFAFEVHSQIGLKAKSAYINRIKSPLLTTLKNGDIVRIEIDDNAKPKFSWLDSVKTARAKAMIKTHYKQRMLAVEQKLATKLLQTIFKVSEDKINEWVSKDNLNKNLKKCANDNVILSHTVQTLQKNVKKFWIGRNYELKKQRLENLVIYSNYKITNIYFDYCCNPKRGDDIIAIKKNHCVSVHNKLCERANKLLDDDSVEVVFIKWSKFIPKNYKMIFSLENKKGALASLLNELVKLNINVLSINIEKNNDNLLEYFDMRLEIAEEQEIEFIKEKLKYKCKIYDFISSSDAYSKS
ncbi:RelA/SpoT family protein [Campylobacter canadensis]|uniref:RelA/SpoT family protein n=1 Tax=Campylobacter canadensis TaxID=449520 RepID=UPI001CC9E1D1|nr:RelA/SpoT family protein [Campylobacter canadensis]MBZ7994852.1 bifunctional (p)ppGpp synthetase/guanosine-3',5'-bis(diphosphate) 3'-pyrophosphohydrolase [Campylobacter canadensis]